MGARRPYSPLDHGVFEAVFDKMPQTIGILLHETEQTGLFIVIEQLVRLL